MAIGLPCTHKSSDLASTGFDPPQPPLKKGEPDSKSPFFKGDLGGSLSTLIHCPRCVHTVELLRQQLAEFVLCIHQQHLSLKIDRCTGLHLFELIDNAL